MQKIKLTILPSGNKQTDEPCCAAPAPKTCCPTEKALPQIAVGWDRATSGTIRKVSTEWTRSDYWGMIKCRISAFRTRYSVSPGLYAVGDPSRNSDVFVSANYKFSFDVLRRELRGINAWVLVLDTKGINVWCAAGKGTFGTDELIKRIQGANLETVVSHRRIIVPQLGAVGVSSGEVKKKTGFTVFYGPVQAADIPDYIRAGYRKTKKMSLMPFSLLDRLVLTPMEINPFMKKYPWFAIVVLFVFGLQPSGILFQQAWTGGLPFLLLGLVTIIAGAFLTPTMLPFIPVRSFAVKGWIMGILSLSMVMPFLNAALHGSVLLLVITWLFFPLLSSYIALQFTGSTIFTGMSGVKKELKIGLPIYIGAAGITLLLVVLYKIREWGIV